MKKSVYKMESHGTLGYIEIEILLDAGRELTDNDNFAISDCVNALKKEILAETISLRPETHQKAKEEKRLILSLFRNHAIYVEEIPNGYCSDYCCKLLPWFIVTTAKGRIKIGWRKRVINIDWSDSPIIGDTDTLFPNEDVTKSEKSIHAWGYEKAQEYIDKILS